MSVPANRDEYLRKPNVAVLSTVGPGCEPHAMPIWYLYEDGDFVMLASCSSQKVRNIERCNQASLVLDTRERPYYAVMIRGTAEIGPPASDELRLRLYNQYLSDEEARARMERRSSDTGSVTIRLRPEKFVEYHGS